MRARSWWLPSVACALALLACNQILDNREGILRQEADPTEARPTHPAGAHGETATKPADISEDAAAPSVDDAAIADAAREAAPACPPRLAATSKTCGSQCVSKADPQYGCAADDCTPCNVPGGIPTCVEGACAVFACDVGRADCNGDLADGCEADLGAVSTCGSCSNACPVYPRTVATCTGSCMLSCEPGWGDCNGDALDGCETPLTADPTNCGMCGRACLLGGCVQGACVVL